MSTFNLTLYSGKKFKGKITKAKVVENKNLETVSSNSTITRYRGKWFYESQEGFLSIDAELDPETNNINSIDVLITNSSITDTKFLNKLQEDVGVQLIIEDYLLKNIKL